MRPLLFAASALLLAGCTLPHDGPSTKAVNDGGVNTGANAATATAGGYTLVELSPAVLSGLQARATAADSAGSMQHLPPPRPLGLIGPGDVLRVVLWATGDNAGSLTDKPGLDLTVKVEPDGSISMPFVGRLHAAGRTPAQLEASLVGVLSNQVSAPQVSVLVAEDETNAVIVQGDIAKPGRQALSPAAPMLRDVLALTGGPRLTAAKEVVRVERGGATITLPLAAVMASAAANVRLGPGDRIVMQPIDPRFYAFGAVNAPGEHAFPDSTATPTLAQALGRISGLQDNRADAGGLYVFRDEPADLTAQPGATSYRGDTARLVYHLRMDDPKAFFLANEFIVRSDDIIFVSNSSVADLAKVIQLITGIGTIGATPRNVSGASW